MARLICLWSVLAVLASHTTFAGTQQGTNRRPVDLRRVETAPPRLVPGDEIDALEQQLRPPARFADYRPQWRVEQRDFTFAHYSKTETQTFTLVLDGDKPVAVVRSGDIMLVAFTPDTARKDLSMPTERLHLDNTLGPFLPTWSFIKNVKTHGSIYEASAGKGHLREGWEVSDRHLVWIRQLANDSHEVEARFLFTVDPVYGYRVDAIRELLFAAAPPKDKVKVPVLTFTPGCYPPWPKDILYNRTAYTPGKGGITGWANNLLCMDRCDSNRGEFTWRDGGFITYLPGPDGWSPCFTRKDGAGLTKKMDVCNAHNDFHHTLYVPELTADASGKFPYRYVHRLLSLPPEMSGHVWQNMELIQQNATGLILKVGAVEDFERQPIPLTQPARGLVWTSGEPPLVTGDAHSGTKAIRIRGKSWPNLPQVSLQPDVNYRLEGWFKILDVSTNGPARAFIRGDFYEWSPHTGPMLLNQTTSAATKTGEWEHVVLDFTAPAWGPFINISFVAENCTALLDDFALHEQTQNPGR